MRVLFVVLVVVLIAGSGCSLIVGGVRTIRTPDITKCEDLEGKMREDLDATFGKPVGVKTNPDGTYTLTHRKGYLTVTSKVNKEGKILSYECTRKKFEEGGKREW